MIEVKEITKRFKNIEVLKGINFSVEKGSVLALLGPNGAGKTTTIKILCTLLAPDAGEAFVNGFSVTRDPKNVRASIGLTGQYTAVDEYLSGRENLEMMGRLYHLSSSDSKSRAKYLLEHFDLTDAGNRNVKTYSGGMRRRLDLAASLIATPPVLFLDEPTSGLDPRSRLVLWNIIKQLVAADVTILLTTQYLEEADELADRIAVLDHGKIIVEGTPGELKEKIGEEHIEFILHDVSDLAKIRTIFPERQISADEKTVTIAMDGSVDVVRQILDKIDDSGIKIESLSIHKPTLDDVFMRFTGQQATVENNKE